MPIYEFHCEECGTDSEVLVRSSHQQDTECPACGSVKLHKKWSVFAATSGGGETEPSCSGDPGSCGRCSLN